MNSKCSYPFSRYEIALHYHFDYFKIYSFSLLYDNFSFRWVIYSDCFHGRQAQRQADIEHQAESVVQVLVSSMNQAEGIWKIILTLTGSEDL